MGVLTLIAILAGILIVLELVKHHLTKGLFKYAILAIIVIFGLLIASSYWDLGTFFSKDNTFSKTGAVVAEDVSEDIENFDWREYNILETIEEKTKDLFSDILDK